MAEPAPSAWNVASRPGLEQARLGHEVGVDRTTLANVVVRLRPAHRNSASILLGFVSEERETKRKQGSYAEDAEDRRGRGEGRKIQGCAAGLKSSLLSSLRTLRPSASSA